jgi:Uncharacterized protein conserved in bacteria (DUF2188)
MATTNKLTYYVTPRSDGNWNVKKGGASRPSVVTPTQREAQERATEWLKNKTGGGEVRIQGRDHKFRNSNTINRVDPDPPKDTRH